MCACTHLFPACYNESVFPFVSEVCLSSRGLDPTLPDYQKLDSFAYLSFPINLSLSLWWWIAACTGPLIAPILKGKLFGLHTLFSLLPGQCQLPWKHRLCLLNILPNSPSLLITLHPASVSLSPQLQTMVPVTSLLLTTLPTRHPFLSPRLRWHVATLATAGCCLLLDTLFSLDVHALLCPDFPPKSHVSPFP